MTEANGKVGIEARVHPRVDLEGEVAIELAAAVLTGSGENISQQGVYLTAQGAIPVRARLPGGEVVAGELVRVENLGAGRIGLAVRFHEIRPDLVR